MNVAPAPASLDLRSAVAKAPLTLQGVGDLSPVEQAQAREHWRIHMAAEFASARVFAGMVPQMMAASLDTSVIREVADMIAQEMDHGVLSARVYAALGGEPASDYLDLRAFPQHPEVPALEGLIRNVLSVSCTGETLAVSVIGSERERAGSAELHRVLTTILRDEVGHARFGWRLVAEVVPTLDADTRRRLSAYLVLVFERDIQAMRGALLLEPASDRALAFGAPDGETQWATFWDTIHQVTIPGLERCGIKAAWAFDKAMAQILSRDRAQAA